MGWLSGYSKRKAITITGGASGAQTDFQLKLAAAYAAAMQSDFDDLRFTQADGTTLIDSWLESKVDDTSAVVWAEFPTTPANTVEQTYYMYYGNAGAASDWDGSATFLQYHATASSQFLDSLVIPAICNYVVKCRATSSAANVRFGISNSITRSDDNIEIILKPGIDTRYHTCRNDTHETYNTEAGATLNQWYRGKFYNDGSISRAYIDDNEISSGITSNLPDETMGLYFTIGAGTGEQEWSFAHKYAANPPTYAFGSEESAPTGAIMNQFQKANMGADLYNGAIIT